VDIQRIVEATRFLGRFSESDTILAKDFAPFDAIRPVNG
jgi:hypothetical protein